MKRLFLGVSWLQTMERSSPWACPPLNLLNWNLAWMWRAPAQESAPLTSWMSVVGARGQRLRSQLGWVYQTAKNNR